MRPTALPPFVPAPPPEPVVTYTVRGPEPRPRYAFPLEILNAPKPAWHREQEARARALSEQGAIL